MVNRLMKQLTETNAIASNESAMRKIIMENCQDYVDEVLEDGLGSLVFHKKGAGPKIMVAAHIDEVGLLVKFITPEGMLVVIPIGAVRPYSMTTQSVIVTTADREEISGLLHTNDDMTIYVDLGLDTEQDVTSLGIDIGDMVTFDTTYKELSDRRFSGKALDDRVGCYALIKMLRKIFEDNLDINFYAAFTSSEEVGMRGGKTSSELIQPDYALIIDVACARNEFCRNYTNNRQLGKGPMLLHYDKTLIPNQELLMMTKKLANSLEIPIQKDMFVNGGTDGGAVSLANTGMPTLVFGIPNRYGHGPVSFADYQDIEQLVILVTELCQELKKVEKRNEYGFFTSK